MVYGKCRCTDVHCALVILLRLFVIAHVTTYISEIVAGHRRTRMLLTERGFPDVKSALVILLRLLVLAHFKAYTSKSVVRTPCVHTLLPTFAFDDLHRTLGRGQVDARLQFTKCT